MVSAGNLESAATRRRAFSRVSHTHNCEVRKIHLLYSELYPSVWLKWDFSFSHCCFLIEISFLERIWFWKIIFISCPSIFFLNIPLQLKRQLRKWWLFSKNYCQCRKRDIQTKYVTLRNAFESTKYFSHIQRASLLHIESIITPLNSTTSNKNWSMNGILIIKRQFGSNKSGIILEQRQGVLWNCGEMRFEWKGLVYIKITHVQLPNTDLVQRQSILL